MTFKVGDIVYRKDMPLFKFRIVKENESFPDMWTVEPLEKYKGFGHWERKTAMIAKDDSRWKKEGSK